MQGTSGLFQVFFAKKSVQSYRLHNDFDYNGSQNESKTLFWGEICIFILLNKKKIDKNGLFKVNYSVFIYFIRNLSRDSDTL